MADRIIDTPATVVALAEQLEGKAGIPRAHLEKDLWVTETLRVLAGQAQQDGYQLVFKGGTSLSKAHRLIHRFSEDVDVLLVMTSTGIGSREKRMKSLLEAVGTELGVKLNHDPPGAKGKKRGYYRSAAFGWATSRTDSSGLRDGVLIELGSLGGSIPSSRVELRPMLAEFADQAGVEFPFQESEAFPVTVMDPSRTLVEKLMLIHTAAADTTMSAAGKRAAARHYYDVFCLLNNDKVLQKLSDGFVIDLARDVHTHSEAAGRRSIERPADGFGSSPAVDINKVAEAADEYETVVLPSLIWDSAPIKPTFERCIETLKASSKLL